MKFCINDRNEKRCFIGKIPSGWRLLSKDEIKSNKDRLRGKSHIRKELYKIFDSQDEYLKLQFESVRIGIEKAFVLDEVNKIITILQSPYIPKDVKPIADELYNKYVELIGDKKNGE